MRLFSCSLPIVLGIAVVSAGCNRSEIRRANQEAALDKAAQMSGKEITVTGCLTAAENRDAFVLSADRNALTSGALYAGSGEVPTYAYELVGTSTDLARHAGKQVEVKGWLDKRDDETDVVAKDKTTEPPRKIGDDTVTPAIETQQDLEIKVRRLHVISTVETGQPCSVASR